MSEKYLLYLTEDETILYKGAYEKLCALKGKFEDVQGEIGSFLLTNPNLPLRLLIDRTYHDIREERIPPLWIWERMSFLFHKKRESSAQGGLSRFHFLKQDRETYLRYIYIPQNDSLMPWLLWTKSLPNPFDGVFFVPLEAGRFLKQHFPPSKDYKMLLYKGGIPKMRHVIFKGDRLLLYRFSQGEEDLRTSLHFLSRTYPDIHEKLQVFSLINDVGLTFPFIKMGSEPEEFLNFLSSLKRPCLSLNLNPKRVYGVRMGASLGLLSLLVLAGIKVYEGLNARYKSQALLPEIERLEKKVQDFKLRLREKDVRILRNALDQYHFLKSNTVSPLKTIQRLSLLLEKEQIRLVNFSWRYEKGLEIVISFLMREKDRKTLVAKFDSFLASSREVFPEGQVQVVEAPFNSGPHEMFKHPAETLLPLAIVKIVLP